MIQIKNITKKYPKSENKALDNISLTINKGEIFGLLGPNGAGKTTLMGIITTLMLPTSGEVYIDGEKITRNKIEIKSKISLVTQHISIRRDMTVMEVMKLAGRLYGMSRKDIKTEAEKILEFTGLKEKSKQVARGLSGGMQRKLMISRALLTSPSVIVLDEPTVGLDPHSRRKIWDLIISLKEKNITVLLTTHYIEEAQNLCNRVALINQGNISEINSPEKMITDLGNYTVDIFKNGKTKSIFFRDKEEALNYARTITETTKIRETTLEDVFIKKVGAEIGENT